TPAVAFPVRLPPAPAHRAILGAPGRGAGLRCPDAADEPAAGLPAAAPAERLADRRPGGRGRLPRGARRARRRQPAGPALPPPARAAAPVTEPGRRRRRLRDEPGVPQAPAGSARHLLSAAAGPGAQARG